MKLSLRYVVEQQMIVFDNKQLSINERAMLQ